MEKLVVVPVEGRIATLRRMDIRATFTNKMGGNNKWDHLWYLWCEPVTNHKVAVLLEGVKTEK